MRLERENETRIVIVDDPRSFSRWIAVGLAAIVLVVILAGQSFFDSVLALLAAVAIWFALRYSSVQTEAVFDAAEGRYRIRQQRHGKEVLSYDGALAEIEGVIVEAAWRSGRVDRVLKLRPALVVGARPLPLTFATFMSGEQPRRIALALRDFLGLPESDLIEDSLRVAARDPDRVNPAVRLARLGKGLSRLEAAAYVERLKAELGERPSAT